MKIYSIQIVLFFATVISVSAINFEVTIEDTFLINNPESEIAFKGYVKNITDHTIKIGMKRENFIPNYWSSTICLGICYAPHVDEAYYDLIAGDSVLYDISFFTSSNPDTGKASLTFWEERKPEKISHTFKASTLHKFKIKQKDILTTIKPGQTYDMTSHLVNLTDQLLNVVITRTVNDIPEDWTTSICIGLSCYAPTLSVVNEVLPPNDSLGLKITYTTGLIPDSGIVHVFVEEPIGGQTEEIVYNLQTKSLFKVFPHDTIGNGPTNTDIELGGYVHNFTDSTIQIEMIRQTNEIPMDWTTSLCFGDVCLAPHIDNIRDTIPAHDSLWFSIHFYSGDTEAEGQALVALTVPGSNDTISQLFKVTSYATAIDNDIRNTPDTFRLLGNFPNPFNISTTVRFESPEPIIKGKFEVFDINGAVVFSSNLTGLAAGKIQFNFDGIGKQGYELTSGIYIYRLLLIGQSGKNYVGTQKFTLLK